MGDELENVSVLIQLAKRHDAQAVNQLLDMYRNYLRILARVWVGRSLPGKLEPSDLVQETLLKAYDRFAQFRGTTEPELAGWLRHILARNIVDVARRYQAAGRKVMRERPLEEILADSVQVIHGFVEASGTSPSQPAERRELGVVLANSLEQLSADHREVVVLRSLQELEWEQVAVRMRRSVDAARKLWARALIQLRPLLEAAL